MRLSASATRAGVVAIALAQGLAGCDSRSPVPTAPNAVSRLPPAPPTVPVGYWELTMTFRSVTGPTPCTSDRDAILSTRHFLAGTAARFLLDLQRSDGSIRLAFYDFGYLDRPYVEYAGDVADGEVSAASPVETGHIVCSGVRFDYCGRRARQGALLGERSFAHG